MNLMLLLDMACSGFGERIGFGPRDASHLSYDDLRSAAAQGRALIERSGASHVVFVATNGPAFPTALFAAAWAGVPFLPANYRLSDEQLRRVVGAHPGSLVISAADEKGRLRDVAGSTLSDDDWCTQVVSPGPVEAPGWPDDPDAIALLLYTSGTTSEPKAAILRHRHLVSYVLGTVEFGAADEQDATLVSVPPYHIAGVSNVLSNVYSGRRVVYLPSFTPDGWLEAARREEVTNALVVPTMLARIVAHLDGSEDAGVPSLRSLAYGGARTAPTVLERAMELFPRTDFVNAYGLTETSSTIAVLGPDDHRAAFSSADPSARARLASVGRPVSGVEVEVRDDDGVLVPAGTAGEIWVRGEQVSGEYVGVSTEAGGWFATRDRGLVDAAGYLFVHGRTDDTIIRGGENVAPAEIEEVLVAHPDVADAAVVGLPDEEWGQRIAAVVVPRPDAVLDLDELRSWIRLRLRSSKTPDVIEVRPTLPHTETGKLLRRLVLRDLTSS